MNKNNKKIEELMTKLKKELAKEYPSRHWQHIDIFSSYWNLLSNIEKKGGDNND